MKRLSPFLVLISVSVVTLSACSAGAPADNQAGRIEGSVSTVPVEMSSPESLRVEVTPLVVVTTQVQEPAQTGVFPSEIPPLSLTITSESNPPIADSQVEATPQVKSELGASDPATVQLASGKPQLVEFFAFW